MSHACSSNSSRHSNRVWIRSPVAIGHVHRFRNLLQRFQVLRRHRFLEPARLERLQFFRDLNRGGRVEAPVHLDEDVEVRARFVPHGFHQRDRSQPFLPLQLVEARAEGIQLRGPVAALHHSPGRLGELLRRAFHRVPAVGVGLDLRPHRAAHQPVNRLVQRLAHDVPARHLDQRDAAHRYLARAAVIVQAHVVERSARGRTDPCRSRSAAPLPPDSPAQPPCC